MSARGGNWRIFALLTLGLFLCGMVWFRLFEKQVLEHNQYAQASSEQSTSSATIQAERGKIFAKDKDDKLFPLAVSVWKYQLLISPRQVKNKEKLAELLAKDLGSVTKEIIFAAINNDKVYIPPIVKDIDAETARKITDQNYAGVALQPNVIRVYPEADQLAAQALGFVGADKAGKYGVEAFYDETLLGVAGSEFAKRDSLGRLIDILGGKKSVTGADLVLTIDHNLQFEVETKLKKAIEQYKADSGSIVVMNPKDGSILAVAGQPTFDPNKYFELKADELGKLLLPSASDSYEPGSVFKPITMATAIDVGAVTPETENVFGGSVQVLDKLIKNAQDKVYGRENMTQVLENSDNVAMVWISNKIGTERQREYFEKFGFGKKSGLDAIGETAGILPPKTSWNDLERATTAFGQGVSVSVIQLAAAYSVIANGGSLVTPHLAQKTVQNNEVEILNFPPRGQVITSETAAKIRQMLVGVVELGHGKRAKVEGVQVGGKTGTAQVPDPKGGYYEERHIGTFAGLFPANDPRFVMVVRLDNPKTVQFAESSAAPTFGEIASWMANYYGLR